MTNGASGGTCATESCAVEVGLQSACAVRVALPLDWGRHSLGSGSFVIGVRKQSQSVLLYWEEREIVLISHFESVRNPAPRWLGAGRGFPSACLGVDWFLYGRSF